jgi:chemotaxis protein MotB
MAGKGTGTIVIKKIKKGGHGHHGGAWKVAYADFVTAMMAFFLLLWLLNAATKEQLQGISDYFAPISTTASTSGGGGLLAGKTVAKTGVFDSTAAPKAMMPAEQSVNASTIPGQDKSQDGLDDGEMTEEDAEELLRKREEQQFQEAEAQLRHAIAESPELKGLTKSLLIENTPEGLRIQIMDQEGLPMFPRGEAELFAHTLRVLELVARVVQRMPQDVAISGHTDATRYQGNAAYTNWELSADRANAARRALLQFGVPEARVSRVVGRAATEPLFPKEPEAHGNRRLSVVMLRGTGEKH